MRQVVFRADGGGGYTAEAPSLPGCVVQGKNLSDAMKNIKQAIYAHLDHLQALGQPTPESTYIDIPKAEGVFTQKLLLREDVIQEAQKMFPDDEQQMIMDVLNDYGKQPFELDQERTMVAAIRLSEGHIDKLKQLVADARRDYRDVLSWYAIKFGKYPESD